MRSLPALITSLLLLLTPLVAGILTPEEYERLGRDSAEAGEYAVAAQHYARAAEGYTEVGNHSAAAINHERSATLYANIGSYADYEEQSKKAAVSYALAGEDYLEDGNYWFAANAFARSAAFYNVTNQEPEYREMQIKSGNAYVTAAQYAENATDSLQALYRATVSFFGLDRDRYGDAKEQLLDVVEEVKQEAIESADARVFDVLELFYLPIFTQLIGDNLLSAEKMEEMGELATQMEFLTFAARYYTSAAIFYNEAGDVAAARGSLYLAGNSYQEEIGLHGTWNYTEYLSLMSYTEESLYIWRYLNETSKLSSLEDVVTQNIESLAGQMEVSASTLASEGEYEFAASNFSAAAEVYYVLGRESEFRRLNGLSGWMNLLAGEHALNMKNISLAVAHYDQAGFLLRIARNDTYKEAYSKAAELYGRLGDENLVTGNISFAATNLYRAGRLYDIAGNRESSSEYYHKYISALNKLIELDPQSRGVLLVSIGDAQRAIGKVEEATKSYSEASDELVQTLSSYLASSPELITSIPSLPANLIKAYRLSGQLFLARNIVGTLDTPSMYGTLASLAALAQMYKTASRVHRELAESDISVYDFQSYSVNQLFSGITAVMAGDFANAKSSLGSFESINHHLHSSNRKFKQLLVHCLDWLETKNSASLHLAQSVLDEIMDVTEESNMLFLLQDLETFLATGGDPDELSDQASSEVDAGNWEKAGQLHFNLGLLHYYAQDYNISLSNFEDSSYLLIKSGEYVKAKRSADLAYEIYLDPPQFAVGLRSLSQALMDSNRTLAGVAKVSFKQAIDEEYKVEKAKELFKIANDLEGIYWAVILGQITVGAFAALVIIVGVIIIRRRSKP